MTLGPITPILRIFDEPKARDFYLDFLGFTIRFEHRFAPGFPLYLGITRGGCVLHLSEHHGDASPGAHIRIESPDIVALHAELTGKESKFSRPDLVETPWGTRDLTVPDPFGNRITFFTALSRSANPA